MQPLRKYRLPRIDWILCGLLVLWGAIRLLPGLAHPGIPRWDESAHQAVARGTYAEPWRPHIYGEHIYPYLPSDWMGAGVWLHKPPLPFWAGAIALRVVGITPLALRLVSFAADLAVALGLFLLMRRRVGRLLATLAGATFLSLDFTWTMTQGLLFGDVTDTTLAACVVLSILAIVRAAEQASELASMRWATLAGALVGMGYLCKSALALAPLGVAFVFLLLKRRGPGPGLGARAFAALVGAMAAVAVPWTVCSALAWPAQYRANAELVFAHLVEDIWPWGRPIDGLLNEINEVELFPIPVSLSLLAGVWIACRAWAARRSVDIALAAWIWGSWIVLSLTPSKVPAHGYGVVPAVLAAIAVLVADARKRPVLAAATLGAMLASVLVPAWPSLGAVRSLVPQSLAQTRERPGMAEGLLLIAVAAVGAWLVAGLLRNPRWLRHLLGGAAVVFALALLGVATPVVKRADERFRLATVGATSYTREVGRVLDRATPERSVLFINTERNPECCSEQHSLMFYSGRMAYRHAADIVTAIGKGFAPYLISPLAEHYEPVPGVPANAWWRAYDLLMPRTEPAPLPEGITPLSVSTTSLDLLGIAVGPAVTGRDRWVLIARLTGPASDANLVLSFQARWGTELVPVELDNVLLDGSVLAQASWFVLPFIGPPRHDVFTLSLEDGTPLVVPPEH
jgi:4-amino-4-deoxy-L-arabinose transferase-like glycosyltransferase